MPRSLPYVLLALVLSGAVLGALVLYGIMPHAHAIQSASCSADTETPRVFAIRAKLADDQAKTAETADDPGDVTPVQQREVPALREALAGAITHYLQCDAAGVTAPAAIATGLTERLQADDDLTIAVQPVAAMDGTISVIASFPKDCAGNDNILLMFRHHHNGWQRILNVHSDKYTSISDAFNNFYGPIVTPGLHGTKLIAVAHDSIGCNSRWSDIVIDLFAPATEDAPQKLLDHANIGLYDQQAETAADPTLTARADGFTLRAVMMSHDIDNVFSYPGVFRYQTLADRLDRQPVANNARDFVESWWDETWPTASRWSGPSQEQLHKAWAWLNSDKGPSIAFGPVRACSQAGQFQVQMNAQLYAKLFQGNGFFTMLAITPTPDPDCTGPDLMAKRN